MKGFKLYTLTLLLALSTCAAANNLVLSQDLRMDYPDPILISHTSSMLLIKYDDWTLSHQLVDPAAIYGNIDLTGLEKTFLQSIFLPNVRSTLPQWMQVLSEDQAAEFGLPEGTVTHQQIGEFDLLGTYNPVHGSGYLYLFDREAIHHFVVMGSETHYKDVISRIMER